MRPLACDRDSGRVSKLHAVTLCEKQVASEGASTTGTHRWDDPGCDVHFLIGSQHIVFTDEIIIEPGRAERNYWRDIWRFRDLLYCLAQRDLLVRYRQTAIGVLWAILRPALTMAIFVAFRQMARLQPSRIPDPILVYAALLPWQFFSNALTDASGSLISNANLISKVYFPRLLVPASAILTSLVDLAVNFALLAVLMLWYRFALGWQALAVPLLVLLTFGVATGIGLFFAALNVKYRDFRFAVPFLVQFGLLVSPIAFETAAVPERWRILYCLNPMVGIIDGFRWALLGGSASFQPISLGISIIVTLAVLLLGIRYFRRTERSFADVI
jgi:lipopolysaccharide transport system permease protein